MSTIQAVEELKKGKTLIHRSFYPDVYLKWNSKDRFHYIDNEGNLTSWDSTEKFRRLSDNWELVA